MTWEQVTPFPGNQLYPGRLTQMRRDWGGYDHAIVGSVAIFDNSARAFPELPPDALLIGDGNHRHELARQDGKLDSEFISDLYRGLTRTEMFRYRRGLNSRRRIMPAEVFLALVEEGDVQAGMILDAVEGCGWLVTQDRETGGFPWTNELTWIWKRDRTALVRAIQTYEKCWGRESAHDQARVLKGLGAFWLQYPNANMDRLVTAVKRDKVDVGGLYRSGKQISSDLRFVKTISDGVRYSLAKHYNKYHRAGLLTL